jgi:uncharacterized protein (UPF0248 family)
MEPYFFLFFNQSQGVIINSPLGLYFFCLCSAMSTIRDILNKLKWSSSGGLSDCEIEILHRGAPNDRKVIKGINIKDIAPRAIVYQEGADEEYVVIPYHRVRAIRKGSDALWQKKGKPGKAVKSDLV